VFNVTEIRKSEKFSEDEVLEYAAYAESFSNHPIAVSILKAYGKEVNEEKVESYYEISGHGIKVKADGKEVLAGNIKLMNKENIKFEISEVTGTMVYIAINKKYAGYIIISDEGKEDSKEAIRNLKEIGAKKTVMLTGDAKSVGYNVAKFLGLDEVHAELLPEQKVEELEKLDKQKSANGKLVFVGDGIYDAPVLARELAYLGGSNLHYFDDAKSFLIKDLFSSRHYRIFPMATFFILIIRNEFFDVVVLLIFY